jgi:diadenosine tetraphosphate (Ap4A) HIT family hydrolase
MIEITTNVTKKNNMSMNKLLTVFEDEHFIVSQCGKCNLPGYLILEFKQNAAHLYQLPEKSQQRFGTLVTKLEQAIVKTISPQNIYILKSFQKAGFSFSK